MDYLDLVEKMMDFLKLKGKPFDLAFRTERLMVNIREDLKACKSVLYVGAKPGRAHNIMFFNGMDITILEVWPPFVAGLKEIEKRRKGSVFHGLKSNIEIVEGDITTANLQAKFDIGFWWHGPEHVSVDLLPKALANLEEHTNKIVVLGLPWGHYKQDGNGNPFDRHVSHLQPKFFLDLGYSVEAQGPEGRGSNMLCIKRLKREQIPAAFSSS